MKHTLRITIVVALSMLLGMPVLQAGNDNRRGTAGAPELLINPWARSAGWGGVNVANSRGLESFYTNVAGLSFTKSTEISYSYTNWFGGKSGINSGAAINAFGLAQRIFEKGVAGIYVMTMNFGNLPVTTVNKPEAGNDATFSPTFMNLNVSYAHAFTHSIRGGMNIKIISESTNDVSGSGFGIDAGIQYVTGENDELKFGISLKNWGPSLSFDGAGLSFTFNNENGNTVTGEYRSAECELPTNLNIGVSYDFLFEKWNQRLTLAGSFTSNAFLKDNFILGLEYSLLDRLQLRCGYVAQRDIFSKSNRTVVNDLSAGASFELPLSKKEGAPTIVFDYSYRNAYPLKGTHSIGATIRL
ncbi:MAG: PorV/PorQ family protein [Bacteroidales bacterium]|nr:PorV/PorQ family protein [Bacteroidales bacterium]